VVRVDVLALVAFISMESRVKKAEAGMMRVRQSKNIMIYFMILDWIFGYL
jgi:hypothetical protein